MSIAALLQAVRDVVSDQLGLDTTSFDIQPDGQPPPSFAAARYVSIHATSWKPEMGERGERTLDEAYLFQLTVTDRIGNVPRDRLMGNAYLKAITGQHDFCRELMVKVHDQWPIIQYANKLIAPSGQFIRTPKWNGTDAVPELKAGDWFWSDTPDKGPFGMVTAVYFGDAYRVQSTTDPTLD